MVKLFLVEMGEDASCDCGFSAPEQYVIAESQEEADRLAKAARDARDEGFQAPDVLCPCCMVRKIWENGVPKIVAVSAGLYEPNPALFVKAEAKVCL